MHSKNRVVKVFEHRYQINKLSPEVGSFAIMKFIRAGFKVERPVALATASNSEVIEQTQTTTDEMVRAVVVAVLLNNLDFQELQFLQTRCMQAVGDMESPGLEGQPIPIVTGDGRWAAPEIEGNLGIVMSLTVEVLVWSLADFFSGGGMTTLMKVNPPLMTP